MKILLDLQGAQSESRYRGIGRYSKDLARAIISRAKSHDVYIILNSALDTEIDRLVAQFSLLLSPERILTFPALGEVAEEKIENDFRNKSARLIREQYIADLQPDLVHVSSLFEGYVDNSVTSIGLLDVDYTTATTLYDLVPLSDPAQYLTNETYRRYYLRKAQMLKQSDILLAISKYSKSEAERILNIDTSMIRTIFAGVGEEFNGSEPTDIFTQNVFDRYDIKNRFILHVGALDPRKNPDVLIEAFSKIRSNQASNCKIVFVGHLSPGEIVRVRAIAGRFGLLHDDLIFTGHVSDQHLIVLYKKCEVLVFPSLHEGFGLPALEAMACGAAVLAANNTSLPEVVGRLDALFDPRSASDLAGKLSKILSDHEFRSDLKHYGICRAAQFTWDESARLCVDAFEETLDSKTPKSLKVRSFRRRLKMAFVSPLPGDKTGVADYSANLLPELAKYYEIECIVAPNTTVTDEWIISNFTLRDYSWFGRNASTYDRVLYSMGNSSFHADMLFAMPRIPGVVILHDVFLSNLIEWLCGTEVCPWEMFDAELYISHGLWGSCFKAREGARATIDTLPMSNSIIKNSLGVIVHSQYARNLLLDNYGTQVSRQITTLPQLRPLVITRDKAQIRRKYEIVSDAFLVCSFGLATNNKLIPLLIQTWIEQGFANDEKFFLVLVGDVGEDLRSEVNNEELSKLNIYITGYVTDVVFNEYLSATDVAVQLRCNSRGETSRAILDCMAARVPVIANRHGSVSELPEDCLILLPELVSSYDLAEALRKLHRQPILRASLGDRAYNHIKSNHQPAKVTKQLFSQIEEFYRIGHKSTENLLLPLIANLNSHVAPSGNDFLAISKAITASLPNISRPQIFYDVTILSEQDAKTGIQRVVRAVLQQIMLLNDNDYRVEPVYISDGTLRYARSFIANRLGMSIGGLSDDIVEFKSGDIYLSVDWVPDRLPTLVGWLNSFRRQGGRVAIVVHDLLPLDQPTFFPPELESVFQKWLESVFATCDVIACVSRSVADDVKRYAQALIPKLYHPVGIGYFHHGFDLAGSIPTTGFREGEEDLLKAMKERRPFLVVGTVEPRKGHEQVLGAFRNLWQQGVDVSLTIVGKEGWMVSDLTDMIRKDPEFGSRLQWLQGISDEMLDHVYASSSALIVASRGEGFGLPIIEAAAHEIPVIVRDLPVFREVAGDSATYFSGLSPETLADVIKAWLSLQDAGLLPNHAKMNRQTWAEATSQLLDVVAGRRCYYLLESVPNRNFN